jgi:hypothetical protein
VAVVAAVNEQQLEAQDLVVREAEVQEEEALQAQLERPTLAAAGAVAGVIQVA